MPVVFDFDNGVDGFTEATVTNTTQSINYTENGVDLSLSASTLGGTGRIQFGGTLGPAANLFMNDQGADDTFRLDFGAGGAFSGTAGDSIIINLGTQISGTWEIRLTHSTAGGTVTLTATTSSQSFSGITGTFTGITFTSTAGPATGFMALESLTVKSATCYLGDVLVATPDGQKLVQDLKPGDRLLTADGRVTTVNWLGRQEMATRFNRPEVINPICICKDAIAEGVPSRDLHVSPDHGVEIGGLLINAAALVNGVSIYQMANVPIEGFTYYHVQTEAHELILAENCPSETYLDCINAHSFLNADERERTHVPEMDLPRISARQLVPHAVSQQLAERAGLVPAAEKAA